MIKSKAFPIRGDVILYKTKHTKIISKDHSKSLKRFIFKVFDTLFNFINLSTQIEYENPQNIKLTKKSEQDRKKLLIAFN